MMLALDHLGIYKTQNILKTKLILFNDQAN